MDQGSYIFTSIIFGGVFVHVIKNLIGAKYSINDHLEKGYLFLYNINLICTVDPDQKAAMIKPIEERNKYYLDAYFIQFFIFKAFSTLFCILCLLCILCALIELVNFTGKYYVYMAFSGSFALIFGYIAVNYKVKLLCNSIIDTGGLIINDNQ